MTPLNVSPRTLERLGFPRIREALAGHAISDEARSQLLAVPLLAGEAATRELLARVAALQALV
ncbi:MAG: hypothetical protein FJ098_09190, partial [Deltaproteobacteria bacterium]|nr:hypothetical protein [Deltaproteobacteria bacterium]